MEDSTRLSFEDPRTALKRHGLTPKYSWGQNFLVSPKAVGEIASACAATAPPFVVEIGAGVGTLTRALLGIGAPVIAIERDRDMCRVLREDFGAASEFTLLEADAAKMDYRALFAEHRGVLAGNLPYQITGKLIRAAVETVDRLLRAVIMVQEEVADRLTAAPGTSARGALSVVVQSRFAVKAAVRLKPTAFFPPPKVRSTVLVLDPLEATAFAADISGALFDKVVNAAFSARRKTLRNSLSVSGLGLSAGGAVSLLDEAGIDSTRRPETLTTEEFSRLAGAAARRGIAP